jgi:release factor glutamine methyltransferase
MKLSNWQAQAENELKSVGIEAYKIEVQWLIEDILSFSPTDRMSLSKNQEEITCTAEQILELNRCVQARMRGVPLAYLLKTWHFWDFELKSDHRALVPRSDTERLVETAVKSLKQLLKNGDYSPKIIEIGTGTGCISIALAREIPQAKILALDLSLDALSLAQENIESLGLTNQIQLIHSDLFNAFGTYQKGNLIPFTNHAEPTEHPLIALMGGKVDLVISNPPYIQTDVIQSLDSSVKDFEPYMALDGGMDGLRLIEKIVDGAKSFLKAKGKLMFEIGFDQGLALDQLLKQANYQDVQIIKDYGKQDRVAVGMMN